MLNVVNRMETATGIEIEVYHSQTTVTIIGTTVDQKERTDLMAMLPILTTVASGATNKVTQLTVECHILRVTAANQVAMLS